MPRPTTKERRNRGLRSRGAAGLAATAALLFTAACSNTTSVSTRTHGPQAIAVGVGNPPLTGTLTLPGGPGPFPVIVMLSGSGPSDQDETVADDKPFLDIANGLAVNGIATLRYDKRAYDYPSSIDLSTYTPTEEYVPDALAAIHLLEGRSDIDPSRIFVLGHSEGGTMAPKVVQADPHLAGLILLAAANQPFGATVERQISYLASLPGPIGQQAEKEVPEAEQAAQQIDNPKLSLANRATWPTSPLAGGLGAAYWLDLRNADPVARARALSQPILILQGGRDYQVTVAQDLAAWEMGLAGRPDVTIHVYPKADHLFIDGTGPPSPADYEHPGHVDPQVITDIATWVRSH
jgi:uncharacterized protein